MGFLSLVYNIKSKCVLTEWSGINALLYYGPTLVKSIGLRGDTVTLIVSGGIGIVQFIAVIPAIIYIDRWGMLQDLVGSTIYLPPHYQEENHCYEVNSFSICDGLHS